MIDAQELSEWISDRIKDESPDLNSIECQHTFINTTNTYRRCSECLAPDCQHEQDGSCYTSNPPKYRCKKCGEFYR